MEILTNIFFWLFAGGTLGALVSVRLARRFQERAAFAEYPEDQEKFEFRTKIFYVIFAVFLLAGLSGPGVSAFQFISGRGGLALPQVLTENPGSAPTAESASTPESTEPAPEPTQTGSVAETTTTEDLPEPAATPTNPPGVLGPRVIGNTEYQGANMRAQPSVDAPILAKLRNGTEVLMLDSPSQEGDGFVWHRVQLEDGTTGWVVKWYLLEEPLEFNP